METRGPNPTIKEIFVPATTKPSTDGLFDQHAFGKDSPGYLIHNRHLGASVMDINARLDTKRVLEGGVPVQQTKPEVIPTGSEGDQTPYRNQPPRPSSESQTTTAMADTDFVARDPNFVDRFLTSDFDIGGAIFSGQEIAGAATIGAGLMFLVLQSGRGLY